MKRCPRRSGRWVLLFLAGDLIAGLLLNAAGASANGMRCENKLVQPGDSQYEVKTLCGPPDDIQQRTESRRVQRAVQRPCPNGRGVCSTVIDDWVDVIVDEWTYDFGPNRFLQYLTFESGKLVLVRSGPYGVKQR
ncbi:MAG TPA: DUF2845 domain-containing protein [Polyangiales bacterium]|jgi:hypothetical protein|nr:DUF2845 domain-containing protein [Polyangiales bacterium]